MQDIAKRTLHAWHQHSAAAARGLIALSFDMPNHGSRMVSEVANQVWNMGNEQHAIDMIGMIKGGVGDMSSLMDLVAGYLRREVDAHVCLGWSLGGHAAWQAWFGEDRVDAAVVVVGCPDLMGKFAALNPLHSAVYTNYVIQPFDVGAFYDILSKMSIR